MDPTDALTGLHDNEAFLAKLARLVRVGEPFSVLLVHVDDNLADVNGIGRRRFEVGDLILQAAERALVAVSPQGALVFRRGGFEKFGFYDEFAVLVATAATREVVELGERICAAVAAIDVPESHEPEFLHLSCSIGIARYPTDGQTDVDLLGRAFKWLFDAQGMGGGRVAIADLASMPWLTDFLDEHNLR